LNLELSTLTIILFHTKPKARRRMSETSPGAALRELQQAQAVLRKARGLLRASRADPNARHVALNVGWESLVQAHRMMAAIPLNAATEPVMTKQLAVERYATALLVRLRRLLRNEPIGAGDEAELLDADEELA
jgi:hypothetical protein